MINITDFIRDLLTEHYDLGNVTEVTEIKAGDTNNSFLAVCEDHGDKKTWYVRQYNPAEEERDIIYEHAFEKYLENRIEPAIKVPMPVQTRDGKTWVVAEYDGQSNFYAVFTAISGREPYSWEYNDLSDAAYDSCAEITAKFHAWAYGYQEPAGSGRREPSLEEQFRNWKIDLPEAIKEKEKHGNLYKRYTDYLKTEVDFLMEAADYCDRELKKYGDKLKKCINHKDLNPGNVMFDENDQVCAVFDLDWVNTDYRLYDIAWMGYQITASWDVKHWGEVPLAKMGRFLKLYDQTIKKYESPLGELTREEKEFLPTMMIIGAMKVIMDFSCYEDHAHDVHRVLVNTSRFVESVRYMMNHMEEMKAAVME